MCQLKIEGEDFSSIPGAWLLNQRNKGGKITKQTEESVLTHIHPEASTYVLE